MQTIRKFNVTLETGDAQTCDLDSADALARLVAYDASGPVPLDALESAVWGLLDAAIGGSGPASDVMFTLQDVFHAYRQVRALENV